ncbi:MAG TPA: dihydrodipicolinate synthase family protein [Vicinamibacterales bacterium]|nr:dihydrodipicolinate synthase family protein [Vicinamibacterales bacterium]
MTIPTMTKITLSGVIPILATPFLPDEALDLESWQRLIEFMIELGVDGVTILGVLGESNRLTDRERETLVENAVLVVKKRMPVIVGTSHSGTEAARYLARMAQDLGADAVMVAPNKEAVPSDDRIVETYQRIADGLAIPIVLQDHPASTEVHLSVPLIVRLVREVPAIQCIKEEAVPTAPKIRQLRAEMGDSRLPILSGLGALYAPFDLEAGLDGLNTGFAFPEVLMAMIDAARVHNWQRVHGLYSRFAALIVFEQQPGVAVRKELLRRRGLFATPRVRHPGATITPSIAAQLDALLSRTLPGVDLRRRIDVHDEVTSRP